MHLRDHLPASTRPTIFSRNARGALSGLKPVQLNRTWRGALSPDEKGGEYWAPDLHHMAGLGQMGQWEQLLAQAAAAYTGGGSSGAPSGGPSQGGRTTGMPQPGSTATAVSPTFQTQISPQISPVFSQMQDSAGATQAATTTQYQPGGMSAEGGGATAAPSIPGLPALPSYTPPSPSYFSGPTKGGGLPYTPLDPATLTHLPNAGRMVADIQQSRPFNWTPIYIVGGLAIAGAVAFAVMKKRR